MRGSTLPSFGLDELALVVGRTFDMSRTPAPALRARVKHMQKLGFPKPGVSRGFVATYSIEDVVKVAVAFALLEAGMPSVRACALVSSVWPEPLQAMAQGRSGNATLVVRPHALATIGIRGLVAQEKAEAVAVARNIEVDERARFSATRIIVDLLALSERLGSVLTGEIATEGLNTIVTDEAFRAALRAT